MNPWLAVLMAAVMALAACSDDDSAIAPGSSGAAYQVKGRVRSIQANGRSMSVEHEDIPGFMPSMTMPFAVRDTAQLRGLKPGDAVGFRFMVTQADSWAEEVRKIEETSIPLEATPRMGGTFHRLKEGEVVPDVQLVNQEGATFRLSDLRGKPVVLTFIFTRCPVPSFCPLMSQNFQQLQARMKETGKQAQLLSVTIDPEFDQPEILKKYGNVYTEDFATWWFATAPAETIKNLETAFGVYAAPEGDRITHGLATAIISRDGRASKSWRGNQWSTDEILAELR